MSNICWSHNLSTFNHPLYSPIFKLCFCFLKILNISSMGDRRRRSMAMQMAQYQARIEIEDAELFNAEVELVNSFMQSEHHGESSHRGSVTGRSYVQRDREECHDRMMKDYFIERPRFPAHDFRRRFRMRRELFESILNAVVNHDQYFARRARCRRPTRSITSSEAHICFSHAS